MALAVTAVMSILIGFIGGALVLRKHYIELEKLVQDVKDFQSKMDSM